MARATGAFINHDAPLFRSMGFVVDPAWRVVVSVYSGGAIGRLVPEDVIASIHCCASAWWPEPPLTTIRVSRRARAGPSPRTGHLA
jgi:hypothetical protein